MGGGASEFPQTSIWAEFHSGDDREVRAQRHLELMAAAFWKPIYLYLRRSWNRSDADAKDLTQEFLVHVQEQRLLGRFDREKGNFRGYLKRCLKSFLGTARRDAGRLKRGGGQPLMPLTEEIAGALPAAGPGPEEEFDREWTRELVNRGLADLENRLKATGKSVYFEVLRLYTMGDSAERPSYGEVSRKLGISETQVTNYLHAARQALRATLIELVRKYVVDDAGIHEELASILGDPE